MRVMMMVVLGAFFAIPSAALGQSAEITSPASAPAGSSSFFFTVRTQGLDSGEEFTKEVTLGIRVSCPEGGIDVVIKIDLGKKAFPDRGQMDRQTYDVSTAMVLAHLQGKLSGLQQARDGILVAIGGRGSLEDQDPAIQLTLELTEAELKKVEETNAHLITCIRDGFPAGSNVEIIAKVTRANGDVLEDSEVVRVVPR